MNTIISRKTSTLLGTLENEPIPRTTLAFFERNNQNRYHALVLRLFKQSGLNQVTLANRLGKDSAQINRLLSSAGNWTINTITALLLAMGVDLEDPSGTFIADLVSQTHKQPNRPKESPVLTQKRQPVVDMQEYLFKRAQKNGTIEPQRQGGNVVEILKIEQGTRSRSML